MRGSTKRRICIVVLSRANYARIKTVIREVHAHPDLELLLVVGASALLWRYGNVMKVIEADGFPVSATVYSIVEGGTPATMAKSTGMTILELATIFENLKPDIVLTVADRFETMATAIAASYMNIPVAHTQGGEVTGSIDESVRHAVTKLSHIHMPATKKAAERIIRMGEPEETVFLTGCPAIDIVAETDTTLPADIFERFKVPRSKLDPSKPFLLVLQHPVTTEYGDGRRQITETIKAVNNLNMQTAWIWPNVDAGSDEIAKGMRISKEILQNGEKIHFFLNFSPEDFVRLLANTACMIGNSSSAIREGSFLGTPAVNIGTRQTDRERGTNVKDVEYNAEAIESAVRAQLANGSYPSDHLFGDGKAARRIVDILAGVDVNIQKKITY